MTQIFRNSESAIVNQLGVFQTPDTNTSVREKRLLNFYPVSGLSENTNCIHFRLDGQSLHYFDLKNSRLYVRCKITPQKGMEREAGDIVLPINHLLQSMWSQVEVFFNGKLVSCGTTNFHYKSMIKTLLKRCKTDGEKNQLCTELFYEDTPGRHNDLNTSGLLNMGAYSRDSISRDGKTFEMEGILNEDVLGIEKYIIYGVNIDIKLYPARSTFTLMANNINPGYRIELEEAIFKCCTVDVGSTITKAHGEALQQGGMAQYFFPQSNIWNFSISKNQRNFNETVVSGNIPQVLVVCIVGTNGYNGQYGENPFNFKHHNLRNLSVLVNDVNRPQRPIQLDFPNNKFATALCNTMQMYPNVLIDDKSFSNGYTLFAFDINKGMDGENLPLMQTGTVRLEMQFAEDLTEEVQVLVYGEYASCIRIDQSRAVHYKPL